MIIQLNQDIIDSLSKTELEVIRYINDNEDNLPTLSIVDIAFNTFSSPSTVSRAIRKCGIAGFNELRYKSSAKHKDTDIQAAGEIMEKSLIEAQNDIERISIQNILDSIYIIKNSKRVFVLGRGLSEYVAEEFAFKLQLLDVNAVCIKDPNIMRRVGSEIKSDECLFAFSLNGKTMELIETLESGNRNGCKIINCCCNENSQLSKYATVNLIGYKHEHQAISKYEVSSRVSLSIIARIIIDYLAIY